MNFIVDDQFLKPKDRQSKDLQSYVKTMIRGFGNKTEHRRLKENIKRGARRESVKNLFGASGEIRKNYVAVKGLN